MKLVKLPKIFRVKTFEFLQWRLERLTEGSDLLIDLVAELVYELCVSWYSWAIAEDIDDLLHSGKIWKLMTTFVEAQKFHQTWKLISASNQWSKRLKNILKHIGWIFKGYFWKKEFSNRRDHVFEFSCWRLADIGENVKEESSKRSNINFFGENDFKSRSTPVVVPLEEDIFNDGDEVEIDSVCEFGRVKKISNFYILVYSPSVNLVSNE